MNYFMLDDKKIPLSAETAQGLKDMLLPKYEPFDETVDGGKIRVSSEDRRERWRCSQPWPIRLSIPKLRSGRVAGFCDDEDKCSGVLLNTRQATELRDCLTRAIKFHTKD